MAAINKSHRQWSLSKSLSWMFPIYAVCLPSFPGLCCPALIHASGLFVFGKPVDSFRILDTSSVVPTSVPFPSFCVSCIFGWKCLSWLDCFPSVLRLHTLSFTSHPVPFPTQYTHQGRILIQTSQSLKFPCDCRRNTVKIISQKWYNNFL